MLATPVTPNDDGFIDCVTHNLTGAQILFYLMFIWKRDAHRTVILWCAKGDAEWKANAVRVALSKERRARGLARTFELRYSETWPYTHQGIRGEAIKISRVSGGLSTRMRAVFQTIIKE